MPARKLPPEELRNLRHTTTLNSTEYELLELIAYRRGITMSAAVRHLIREENERAHLDLVEPEFIRRRARCLEVENAVY